MNSVLTQGSAQLRQAVALHQRGHLAQAQTMYEKLLKAQPKHFDVLHLLGVLASQTNNPGRALELIDKAIELNPNDAFSHYNRGLALKALKQLDAAVASYERAIALKLDFAMAHFEKALALAQFGQAEAALASYDRAIAIKGEYAEAHYNRALVLRKLNRIAAAVKSYNQAITVRSDYAKAYASRATALLLAGDFERGWVDYEWRWKDESTSGERRNFAQPLWLGGEFINGKTILLHSEQGLGDTLQFCRYAQVVANMGARVILEVQQPLLNLLAGLAGVSQLLPRGSALPHFDYHCPLLSLPLAFKTDKRTIPSPGKYLSAHPIKVARWEARLPQSKAQRVGLAWSGNALHPNDHERNIALGQLIRYLPSQLQYISLQKEVRETDRSALEANPHILDYSAEMKDFADTAALCECMDVVLSVDTSVVHLSAALGKRTWIFLAFHPDWRWQLDRDDSPWYASAKLYRQESAGDWGGALERAHADLTPS